MEDRYAATSERSNIKIAFRSEERGVKLIFGVFCRLKNYVKCSVEKWHFFHTKDLKLDIMLKLI